jgi:hypothetical protein
MFDRHALREHFFGYNILDCVVESARVFYFVAHLGPQQTSDITDDEDDVDEDEYRPKRVIRLELDSAEGSLRHISLNGFSFMIHIDISFEPDAKPIVMDGDSNAWVNNPGTNGLEKEIPAKFEGGLLGGAVARVKSIGGPAICCVAQSRGILIREGVEQWRRLGPEMPSDADAIVSDEGFEDFDAFSDDDIYAVGGDGDVWHFDGRDWRQLDFPSNLETTAVCCAGDGLVYVGLEAGTVYRGRGDSWELIHEDDMTLPFKDMVWYDGKVWCTSDYGIWTIENGSLTTAPVKPGVKVCAGHLSTRDGVLLVAGYGGACFLKDGGWTTIFHAMELT